MAMSHARVNSSLQQAAKATATSTPPKKKEVAPQSVSPQKPASPQAPANAAAYLNGYDLDIPKTPVARDSRYFTDCTDTGPADKEKTEKADNSVKYFTFS